MAPANAKITKMIDAAKLQEAPKEIKLPKVGGLPNPNDKEAVFNFLKERFSTVSVSSAESMADANKTGSISILHSQEYIEDMAEGTIKLDSTLDVIKTGLENQNELEVKNCKIEKGTN